LARHHELPSVDPTDALLGKVVGELLFRLNAGFEARTRVPPKLAGLVHHILNRVNARMD